MIDTKEEIIAAYNKTPDKYGVVNRLARKNKVKPEEIFKLLRDEGVIGKSKKEAETILGSFEAVKTVTNRSNGYSDEDISILCSMKSEGKTWAEISKVLNRSEKTLSAKYQKLLREGKVPDHQAKPSVKSAPAKTNTKPVTDQKVVQNEQKATQPETVNPNKGKLDAFAEMVNRLKNSYEIVSAGFEQNVLFAEIKRGPEDEHFRIEVRKVNA